MSAKDIIENLSTIHANAYEGRWRIKAEQGNSDYSPHYGVVAGEYYTVTPARSDWEGFGYGASLNNAKAIVEEHNVFPKMLDTLAKLLELHQDSGEKVHEWTNVFGGSVEESLRPDAKNSCTGCGYQTEWPCETVTIIEEGLK
ncbi:hypothetical protein SEA_ATUIN_225 [Arthrobacter phage Atuin]|nr:hypothetical protein SEA_ATUIN_24 [Arthrobacter phage Atuin]